MSPRSAPRATPVSRGAAARVFEIVISPVENQMGTMEAKLVAVGESVADVDAVEAASAAALELDTSRRPHERGACAAGCARPL